MIRISLKLVCISAVAATMPAWPATAQQVAVRTETVVKESAAPSLSVNDRDRVRMLQSSAIREQNASWGRWGTRADKFGSWSNHSNRLIPLYTFGITLDMLREEGSVYADADRLETLYGRVPDSTLNPYAGYFDQTDIYRLQVAAINAGYRNIVLIVFDGMDWQTTRAAAMYKSGKRYDSGRGTGLAFQDDRRTVTDFGLYCTSPLLEAAKIDVNSQTVISAAAEATGGYDWRRGGIVPWLEQSEANYLIGTDREQPHAVTDSASSASSMTSGIKTYNGSINVAADGSQVVPLARRLQADKGFKIGVVTSVPVSHATPAAAYANNVLRQDYQDIARDLVGLPSSSHRDQALPGVDVLIGGGWGEGKGDDRSQGDNFQPGNPYLHQDDIKRVDIKSGGKYVVARRTENLSGRDVLMTAARTASKDGHRLLGFFGTKGGHLPFRTADGNYNPSFDIAGTEKYSAADIDENPTLADMTEAALAVLQESDAGFWLMIEPGDVDWANHANNIDNSIGAVLSGEAAFDVVMNWVDAHQAWDKTAVFVAADHGHFLVIKDPQPLIEAGRSTAETQ